MGRLIEADELKAIVEYCILANVPADAENTKEDKWNDWIQTVIDKQPTVEAIPKDQYEARLKADMAAMLTEIQMEIEEIEIDVPFGFEPVSKTAAFYDGVSASSKVVQQKINELKGESKK